MQGFTGVWRVATAVGRSCLTLAFATATTVGAAESCPTTAACSSLERMVRDLSAQATDLRGGGRALVLSPRSAPLRATAPWSAAMSRHDFVLGAIDADHDDAYLYRLPYADEVSFPVIQAYDAKLSHRGAEEYTLDFGMPVGTPVHAARDGIVVLLEDSHDGGCWREECGQLANFVVLLHSDGTTGEYFHLQRGSVQVRPGEYVQRGQWLARSGNTGYSTAPHLHFGVYRTERDGHTRSIAVQFQTRVGALAVPRTGARYLNAGAR